MWWQYLVMHSLLGCWHSQDVRDTHRLSLLFYLTFLRHLRLKRAAELLNRRDRDNLPSRSEAAAQTRVSEYFILTLDESMVRCLIICLTWCSLCHYIYMSVWSRHVWPLLVPGSLTLTLTIRVSAPGPGCFPRPGPAPPGIPPSRDMRWERWRWSPAWLPVSGAHLYR